VVALPIKVISWLGARGLPTTRGEKLGRSNTERGSCGTVLSARGWHPFSWPELLPSEVREPSAEPIALVGNVQALE
jgi:hypothetical protein